MPLPLASALRRSEPIFTESSLLQVAGIILALAGPLPLYWLLSPETNFTVVGLVIAALEIAGALTLAIFLARNEFETTVFVLGLYGKLVASAIYLQLCYHVYRVNDAFGYFDRAQVLTAGGHIQFEYPFWATNAVYNLTAILIGVLSPSITLAFCSYAIVAYFGQMLLYRAFCIGVPNGDRRMAAVMCFFFPSLVYWTSPIGKDAIVLFGLGLASVGAAKLFCGRASWLQVIVGLAIIQLIRPHIAALYGVSLFASYLILRRSTDVSSVLLKYISVPVLLGAALIFSVQTQTFFGVETIDGAVNRTESIRSYSSSGGGSDFGYHDSLLFRVSTSPGLLFRPFPWEVGNVYSAIASAEGVFTLVMLWVRRRAIFHFVLNWRQYSFVSFMVLYAFFTITSLSTVVNNMGTLARQRVMVFPIFLVVAAVGFSPLAATKGLSPRKVSPR